MTTQLTQPSDEALVMLEALGRTLELESAPIIPPSASMP
jgi:hypothetical protein